MNITDFDVYKDLLKEKSGLVLTPDKSYLLESRLTPVAKEHDFPDLVAMSAALRGVPNPKLVNAIVEAMTTNETSFFRDSRPFDIFREFVMPYMIQERAHTRRLNMWCAAASSGQEPYTVSMLMKEEESKLAGWNVNFLATDISEDILEVARTGLYSQFEVQRGLPITLLMKYFTQVDDRWQINDDIKKMVQYKYLNLLDSLISLGELDVVFCRNVLIYFDEETKRDVLERMAKQMKPDAFLFLGGAETVIGITDAFKAVPGQRGLYAQTGSKHLEAPAPASAAL